MNMNSEQVVSVEQFVCGIMERFGVKVDNKDILSYGYAAGWLEDQDITGKELALERKTAARIVHEFLLRELKESDETDWSAASKLQDLYECRSCVGHVAQVYVKGIMDGHMDDAGRFVFGMNERVSLGAAKEIIELLFDPEMRKLQQQAEVTRKVEVITVGEALKYLQKDKNAQLIDVCTVKEFEEGHLKGAINIPLVSILKNPYVVSERRDIGIMLYCKEGYQSDIAARCLTEAGYEKVFCFAWKNQENSVD